MPAGRSGNRAAHQFAALELGAQFAWDPDIADPDIASRPNTRHAGMTRTDPLHGILGTDVPRNEIEFDERRANRTCFGCTLEQRKAQGPIPHWLCMHHGQVASDADRARRVAASGLATLSDGSGRQRRRCIWEFAPK